MFKGKAEAEREFWLQTKAKGKNRFIKREMVWSLLFWLLLMTVLGVIGDRMHRWPLGEILITSLIMLPIVLLGGYLSGGWKWKGFEKKYSE